MTPLKFSLLLLATFLFFGASALNSPYIYKLTTRQPEAVREQLEIFLESLNEADDLEIVSHDKNAIYISREPRAVTLDDDDESSPSVEKLGAFLKEHNISKELLEYLGRHGSIDNKLLSIGQMALNNRVPKGYTKPEEMRHYFEFLSKKYDFAHWIDIAKEYNNGTSIEGRPIHALRLNLDPREDKPAILFASCHHARELITPEIALGLADFFTVGYDGGSQRVLKWLKEYDIWIVPVVNVDGHEFVWKANNMWRKNRRQLDETEYGVDLNRNYDLGWETQGGASEFSSETYRGEKPFSEPESQTIKNLSEAMKFAKVIDFHSSGREVLLHYSRVPMPEAMKSFIAAEGEKLAKAADYHTRVPSDDGEHQEWQIKVNTAYSFLVETGTSFQPTYEEAEKEVLRVLPLVEHFLDRPISVRGRVTDSHGKAITDAQLSVHGINWQLGETRTVHPTSGLYNLFLPTGEHTIQVSAPNRQTKNVTVSVTDRSSTIVDVTLE